MKYEEDKKDVIKQSALMLKGYDESEKAIIKMMNEKRRVRKRTSASLRKRRRKSGSN